MCRDHKQPGMVNVKSPRCKEQPCEKAPTSGFNTKTHCPAHATAGMRLIPPKCEHFLCYKVPQRFGYLGAARLRSAKHAGEGMIALNKNTDPRGQGVPAPEKGHGGHLPLNHPGHSRVVHKAGAAAAAAVTAAPAPAPSAVGSKGVVGADQEPGGEAGTETLAAMANTARYTCGLVVKHAAVRGPKPYARFVSHDSSRS